MASGVSDSSGVMSELSDLASPKGNNNVPSSTDVAVEMDRMDRILAAHAPPPPPPRKEDELVKESESESPQEKSSFGEDGDSPTSSDTSSPPRGTDTPPDKSSPNGTPPRSDDDVGQEKAPEVQSGTILSPPSLFPHTASPRPKHRENYNDDYPGDVSPHKASHESSLPSVPDEEQDTENMPISNAREEANKKLSSIDAFEASFDTAFPTTFTSPKEGSPPKTATSEIYNPFFSSPGKKSAAKSPSNQDTEGGGSSVKERKWGKSLRARSPVRRGSGAVRGGSEENGGNDSMPKMASSVRQPTIEDLDEDRSTFMDPKSPDRESGSGDSGQPDPSSSPKIVSRALTGGYSGELYRTPPHFSQKIEEPAMSTEPRRPEKSVSASARARYEKALQPRGFSGRVNHNDHSSASISVDTTVEATKDARNSPSTVLRRLQQRRAKSSERYLAASSSDSTGGDSRRVSTSSRSMRLSIGLDDSPFDEEGGANRYGRVGSGRTSPSSQNGMQYRTTQMEADSSYQRSRTTFNSFGKKLSPDSMQSEFRALDAMASGNTYLSKRAETSPTGSDSPSNSSAARLAALKQRRSVKQPVSYAEPSLNTKVRRGDVYFPKTGDEGDDNSAVVSPSNSDDLSGSRGRSSRSRSGASPDEVLKDLAGPATVRS